jgi:hypothetical protein
MIRFIQTWFTWIMVVFAIVFAFFSQAAFLISLQTWLLFFLGGVVGLWAAMGHLLQPEQTAKSIGWKTSPFQREMGFTNLAMGVAGIISPWQSIQFQFCLILILSILWWGCAYGHIKEAIEKKNFAVHNAGPMLYTTILVPVVLWGIYWWG